METPARDQHVRLSWSVPCVTPTEPCDDAEVPIPAQDAPMTGGRVRVLVLGDRVGMVLPPGDTLVLTHEEANYLAITLDRAVEQMPPSRPKLP